MLVTTGINTILLFGLIIFLGASVSFYISKKDKYCYSFPLAKLLIFISSFVIAAVLISFAYFLINRKFPSLFPSVHSSALTLMTMTLTALFVQIIFITRRDRMHAHKTNSVIENPTYLLLFELSIILILFFCMESTSIMRALSEQSRYFLFFFVIFLAACLMVLLIVFQTDRRRTLRRIAENEKEAALKQLYYRNVRDRRAELDRIRSEYDHDLNQILSLLKEKRMDEANAILQNLSGRIESTKEYPYCGIPVVNAVLTEKDNQCRENGVVLSADLLLPDHVLIQDLDLCMALGNILDNAIRECQKAPTGTDSRPEIMLSGRVKHGYLIIKCKNPCFSDGGSIPEGTGYGLKILKDLAGRYHGDFRSGAADNVFTVQLSLLLPGEFRQNTASG